MLAASHPDQTPPDPREQALAAALRRGNPAAFERLVASYGPALQRLAEAYLPDPATAEEVVQETWLGVLRGVARFEGRSSLKTWIFRILVLRARTRARREGRAVPFSALDRAAAGRSEGTERPWEQRLSAPAGRAPASPEEHLLADETRARIVRAVAALRPTQREVIRLRYLEGWSPAEVCGALGISPNHQRVALHRARAQVRRTLGPDAHEEA